MKILQAPNFQDFRNFFRAKLEKFFLVPANTFENVNGQFPIGFFVWNTAKQEKFSHLTARIFNKKGDFIATKEIYNYDNEKYISEWLEVNSKNISKNYIGHLASVGNDFQNQRMVFIDDVNAKRKQGGRHTMISAENLIVISIYFSIRKVIPADWLNDRDQFLFPNKKWETDTEFQNDCLCYTLFNNNIQSKYGTNHWIPFTEHQVIARDRFDSHFMTDFIGGKNPNIGGGGGVYAEQMNMFIVAEPQAEYGLKSRSFSPEAQAVFEAGQTLWKYYHAQKNINVNASLYDIREYFQGRNDKGKMNNKSTDEKYNELIGILRDNLNILAEKIAPKVYEYEFLKK